MASTKKQEWNKEIADMIPAMSLAGITQENMCKVITAATGFTISRPTLEKYYREELDNGKDILHAKLASNLVHRALTDDKPACLFFLLKTRYKYRETNATELSGPDGMPLNTTPPSLNFIFTNEKDGEADGQG